MKKHFFYFLFLFFSCNDTDFTTEHELSQDNTTTLKSNSLEYSLFQNIESFSYSNGCGYIRGEIYCSKATTATLMFAYKGDVGSSYRVVLPVPPYLTPASGPSFRTITIPLQTGINTFSIDLLVSKPRESAYARLVLVSIGGDTSLNGEGYVDLVTNAYCTLHDPGGSSPAHSTCSNCGFLNSKGATKCVSCGK